MQALDETFERIEAWRREGVDVALATVVATRRSAPRPVGAKMAVSAPGELVGMVSGGCVEGAVVQAADSVLRGGPPRLECFGVADEEAFAVGLPCGGEIEVWIELVRDDWLGRTMRGGGRGARVVRLDDGSVLVVEPGREHRGSLGAADLDDAAIAVAGAAMWSGASGIFSHEGTACFVDPVTPPPRLLIFGAVDYARPLSTLARHLGWHPYVIDPRGFFAAAGRFPDAEGVIADWPVEAIARLGGIDAATAVVVLSHDPKIDDPALEVALRSASPYVGAIGSRRMQADRRARLSAAGLGPEELERLAGPAGLDLGALTPEETAISILAEIVAVRHGRIGGRLREGSGRIHGAGPLAAPASSPAQSSSVEPSPATR